MTDEKELAKLRTQVEAAVETVQEQKQRIDDLEAENEHLRQRVVELEQMKGEVDSVASMFTPDDGVDLDTKTKRAAFVLRQLYEDAEPGSPGSMDYDDIYNLFQRDITDSYASQIRDHVPTLVEDDSVCWVVDQTTHDDRNKRVVLDIDGGEDAIPVAEDGVAITSGVAADD